VTDRLYRHPTDRTIAGVAGGLAAWLGLDPSLVRIAWVLLAIFSGGLFVLVYIVMVFVVPLAPPGWVPRQRGSGPGPGMTGAGPAQGAVPGWQPGGTTWAPPGDWPTDRSPAPGQAQDWGTPGPATSPGTPASPSWGSVPPPEGAWTAAPMGGEPGPQPAPPSQGSSWTSGNMGLVFGVILLVLGIWFLVDQYVSIDWDVLWPVAIMVAGGALIAGAVLRSRSG
jgi:phage shock protein C